MSSELSSNPRLAETFVCFFPPSLWLLLQVPHSARVPGVHDFESDGDPVGLECEAGVVSELQGFSFPVIEPWLSEWHGPRGRPELASWYTGVQQ